MNIKWNTDEYAQSFSFVYEYGKGVLDLVDEGTGAAVDLGCGTGALSGGLARKGYDVIGVDASTEMLEKAMKEHPDITFMQADALTFSLEEKARVIFSNAVFHWIDKEEQDALARNISEQLLPGGVLVTEFGGKGCAESVHSALEECFTRRGLTYPRTFYFPTIGEYAAVLERNGFMLRYAILFDRPTVQQSAHGVKDWIRMFVKKPFENMEPSVREEILEEVEQKLKSQLYRDGKWYVDYVRIRVKAVKTPVIS